MFADVLSDTGPYAGLMTQLPALLIVVPLLGAVVSAFLKRGKVSWLFAMIITALTALVAVCLLLKVLATGAISYAMGGWAPPIGIELRVDELSAFIVFLVSVVSLVVMPFALRSVQREVPQNQRAWFYTMYLVALTGLLGIAVTGDAFNAFVFLEISSLATYTLIALSSDRRGLVAAYQYLIMGTIGATFYVIGVGLLFTVTGTLNFVDLASRLGAVENAGPVYAALAFMFVGVGLKLALFPMHVWLPNAYAYAPSFATIFLAATATKVAVYLLLRLYFSVFGAALKVSALPLSEVILVLSLSAMFVASIIAVYENNIKRMLAYSSVAQIGYITLGIALANKAGLTGSIVHLFNHALMKAALFMAICSVVYRVSTPYVSDLGGIGRKMPLTMGLFVVAGLSIIGVPGTAGFISKWQLGVGAIDKGWWPLVFLLVASSLIAVIYIGKVVEVAYFREPSDKLAKAADPQLSMMIPLVLMVAATIYFGIDTTWSVGIAERAADLLLGGLK